MQSAKSFPVAFYPKGSEVIVIPVGIDSFSFASFRFLYLFNPFNPFSLTDPTNWAINRCINPARDIFAATGRYVNQLNWKSTHRFALLPVGTFPINVCGKSLSLLVIYPEYIKIKLGFFIKLLFIANLIK